MNVRPVLSIAALPHGYTLLHGNPMIGRTLAHYEVLGLLGRGGMGEVYRARDTKLGRDVALKVLPREMSGDPERIARFQREARTLASLQHNNIASIYGFEDTAEARFLVMELVEGEDLSQRIERGALPLAEAVEIAVQIATGLEVAHEQNIVHRDLKPANVKLGAGMEVKILDFGLARAYSGPLETDGDPSKSPTITAAMTQVGTILGTAAYMSPEQARGKNIDKRADIWAFGCVFYEMLTGQRAFRGDDITDVIASVVKSEPDWDALPATTPAHVRSLLWRCLQKDPRRRLRDIGEALFALNEGGAEATKIGSKESPRAKATSSRWALFTGGLVAGVILGATSVAMLVDSGREGRPDTIAAPMTMFEIVPPEHHPYVRTLWADVAISPDGRTVVYATTASGSARYSGRDMRLARRNLDSARIALISPENGGSNPMYSPDGRHIAYVDQDRLMRLPTAGGPPSTVCDSLLSFSGGSWSENGWIVFAAGSGQLLRVREEGGQPELIATVDTQRGERRFVSPLALPGGKSILVGVMNAGMEAGGAIYVVDAEAGTRKLLTAGITPIGLTPAGNLVFGQSNTIRAQRFDLNSVELRGESISLIEGVGEDTDLSRDGTLAYGEGGSGDRRMGKFIWVARDGTVEPFSNSTLIYPRYPRFSPDGERLVYTSGPAGNGQLWVLDLVRAGPPVNLTFKGHNTLAVFDPTGRRLAFDQAEEMGTGQLCLLDADGSQLQPTAVPGLPTSANPGAWTASGQIIVSTEARASREAADILAYSVRDSTVSDVVATPFVEGYFALSPDERWLAYESDRSGSREIWVQALSYGAPRRVSSRGGADPVWARDGSELYYQEGSALIAVTVSSNGDDIELGAPVELFRDVFIPAEDFTPRSYDVHPDGRFLMVADTQESAASPNLVVIQNWAQDVDRRLASGAAGSIERQ